MWHRKGEWLISTLGSLRSLKLSPPIRVSSKAKSLSSFGLKVNGRIFAMIVRGKFVAKLPRARVDEIVTSGIGKNFEGGPGRVMKEWVAIESDELDWVGLAREAREFVEYGYV